MGRGQYKHRGRRWGRWREGKRGLVDVKTKCWRKVDRQGRSAKIYPVRLSRSLCQHYRTMSFLGFLLFSFTPFIVTSPHSRVLILLLLSNSIPRLGAQSCCLEACAGFAWQLYTLYMGCITYGLGPAKKAKTSSLVYSFPISLISEESFRYP